MYDLGRGYSITFQCNENETYDDIQANGGQPFTCGQLWQAFLFFISFQVICSQIFFNLFMAIIIEAFIGKAEILECPVSPYQVQEFVKLW